MGKKSKKGDDGEEGQESMKIFCFYCDKEFDDEKLLVLHQKAKHFKCDFCQRKLNSAGGLAIHCAQVHKETLTKVPFAKPGRDSAQFEIYGMQGLPTHYVAESSKKPKLDTPFPSSSLPNPIPMSVNPPVVSNGATAFNAGVFSAAAPNPTAPPNVIRPSPPVVPVVGTASNIAPAPITTTATLAPVGLPKPPSMPPSMPVMTMPIPPPVPPLPTVSPKTAVSAVSITLAYNDSLSIEEKRALYPQYKYAQLCAQYV